MAAQSAPASPTWGLDLLGQLKRKFGVGPQNWDRFTAAADGNESPAYVPPSGANVTLRDFARDPATISFPTNDDPAVRAAVEDDGGWVGTPDPTKFAPGTTHLSPRELREEIEKGNVMLWKDFKRSVSELSGEDRDAMQALVEKRMKQERLFVTLKDGSKVSLWDLHQYVENNPELEAMYERRRRFPAVDPEDPAGRSLPSAPASGLERSAGQPVAVMTPEEANELEMDWGHVGSGSMWRRRPTRWLGGLDGVKDWDLEVYTHEPMTNQVLGLKYGGRDPYAVIQDPSYAQDVMRCGPLLGMTFVMTAARDLPLPEVASTWRDLLSSYLQRQAPLSVPRRLRPTVVDPTDLNGVTWPRLLLNPSQEQLAAEEAAGCDELGVSWQQMSREEHEQSVRAGLQVLQALPGALCPGPDSRGALSGTSLVDPHGRSWRKGAALWLTLEPEGGLVVQAQSPGLVGEQESFLLGRLAGHGALSGAAMDAFLGPQPVDPDMAATARAMLLLPANGFTSGNKDRDPNHPMFSGPPARLPAMPADPSAFRLAPKGQAQEQQSGRAGTLLAGIRETRLAGEVRSLLARASEAAAEVAGPSPAGGDGAAADSDEVAARAQRAREAAGRVLREGVAALGPEARRLMRRAAEVASSPAGDVLLPELRSAQQQPGGQIASDLFSLARSLDASDDA